MANLTKTAVERLDCPEGRAWAWEGDDSLPGFGVRCYPSGRKAFALRYRTASGRQRMLTLGDFGTLTVKQARDMARREKVKVLEGEDPQAEREKESAPIRTVAELMGRWLEDYAKKHRKRWPEDERRIDARIRPGLGSLPVTDVTTARLTSWHSKIGEESPVEANRCLETLRAAWTWAHGLELIPEAAINRTGRVKRFKEKSRDRWLRRDETTRLLEAAGRYPDPYIGAAIRLLISTGLRKSELLSARWTDVDLDRAEIRLPDTKSGGAQTRTLSPMAIRTLQSMPREVGSPWLFPSPLSPRRHREDIRKPWASIRKEAGIKDVTLHDLRRTAGSYMAQAGVPIQTIMKVLGQSNEEVTKIYARLSSKNEREALSTLSDELEPLADPSPPAEPQEATPEIGERLRGLLSVDDPDALRAGLRSLLGAIES